MKAVLLSLTALVAAATVALAQTAQPSAQAAPPSGFAKFAKETKNPTDWLSWGADMRIRNEYYDNSVSCTELDALSEQDVVRIRGRIWASLIPVKDLSLNARLSAEPRVWFKPTFVSSHGRGRTGTEWRYGIIDNLNLKWTNAFQQPLSVTIGRQDIMFGDYWNWWLTADGTPGDGSWAFFLDSIRVTYELRDIKTRVDAIAIYQSAWNDEFLPVINGTRATLTEQNEQGIIAYVSNKSLKNTQIDGFLFYKRDNQELANGDTGDIYTIGAKISGNPGAHLLYSVEGAYQFGSKRDPMATYPVNVGAGRRDISAYGANARLTYQLKDKLNSQFQVFCEYLSGDDPDTTDKDEMFDILWGRWPRFSELYIYSYIYETGGKIAQMNNLFRPGVGFTLNPIKNMTLSANYSALYAPQEVPTRALRPALFSKDGNFRGHYIQAILRHQFNKHINAHLWGEWVWEGNYYAQRDMMTFLRAEVMFTF